MGVFSTGHPTKKKLSSMEKMLKASEHKGFNQPKKHTSNGIDNDQLAKDMGRAKKNNPHPKSVELRKKRDPKDKVMYWHD